MRIKVIGYILAICLVIFSFVFVIDITCFNEAFYAYEYPKNNVSETIGISDEDLKRATDVLLGYITGENESLDVKVQIDGKEVMMFNERETAHMVDVRDLYQMVSIVRFSALITFIVCMAYLLIVRAKDIFRTFFSAYKKINLVLFSVVGALSIWAIADFDAFWRSFHQIFFNNDLWLLDPTVDRLIMMVPGPFFFDLVLLIIVVFVVLTLCAYLLLRYLAKREIDRS